MWKIKRVALEFILQAARNNYPLEFAGLLRARDNVITEVLIIPGTRWHEHSASLLMNMVPLDPDIVGSVHSHPGPALPSKADLEFFSKFGKIHLIAGYPYTPETLRAFLPSGKQTSIDVVD